MTKRTVAALAILLLAAGCISYEYKGESGGGPTTSASVFLSAAKIRRTYQVLGQATVSGDYREVSRDRLMNKLISEAEKNGADAVLVVEQQVLPYGSSGSAPGRFMTAYDYDDTSQSWNQVYRDVDQRYSNLFNTSLQNVITRSGGGSSGTAGNVGTQGYKRIIRAEFLKYTDTKPIAE